MREMNKHIINVRDKKTEDKCERDKETEDKCERDVHRDRIRDRMRQAEGRDRQTGRPSCYQIQTAELDKLSSILSRGSLCARHPTNVDVQEVQNKAMIS